MKIAVTDWCIQNGKGYNCYSCPVALALKKAGASHAMVWTAFHRIKLPNNNFREELIVQLRFLYNNVWIQLTAPDTVKEFIQKYDKSNTSVNPFSFDIDILHFIHDKII